MLPTRLALATAFPFLAQAHEPAPPPVRSLGRQYSTLDNLNNYNYWNFHPYPQRTYSAELKFDL